MSTFSRIKARIHRKSRIFLMDTLAYDFDPTDYPPSFYLALATLVDTLPHSDHESLKRVKELRDSAKETPRPRIEQENLEL
jgi:hypothetical protein